MPSYDYLCGGCGHTFEKMQAMSAKPSRKCPKCKKYKLKRLIGAGGGAIVKGSNNPTYQRGRPPTKGRPERIRF